MLDDKDTENNIGKTEKQTMKFVGRLVFSDRVFSRNASDTFFKVPDSRIE